MSLRGEKSKGFVNSAFKVNLQMATTQSEEKEY